MSSLGLSPDPHTPVDEQAQRRAQLAEFLANRRSRRPPPNSGHPPSLPSPPRITPTPPAPAPSPSNTPPAPLLHRLVAPTESSRQRAAAVAATARVRHPPLKNSTHHSSSPTHQPRPPRTPSPRHRRRPSDAAENTLRSPASSRARRPSEVGGDAATGRARRRGGHFNSSSSTSSSVCSQDQQRAVVAATERELEIEAVWSEECERLAGLVRREREEKETFQRGEAARLTAVVRAEREAAERRWNERCVQHRNEGRRRVANFAAKETAGLLQRQTDRLTEYYESQLADYIQLLNERAEAITRLESFLTETLADNQELKGERVEQEVLMEHLRKRLADLEHHLGVSDEDQYTELRSENLRQAELIARLRRRFSDLDLDEEDDENRQPLGVLPRRIKR